MIGLLKKKKKVAPLLPRLALTAFAACVLFGVGWFFSFSAARNLEGVVTRAGGAVTGLCDILHSALTALNPALTTAAHKGSVAGTPCINRRGLGELKHVKGLVAKPEDLSLILETHTVEGNKNNSCRLSSDLHICVMP